MAHRKPIAVILTDNIFCRAVAASKVVETVGRSLMVESTAVQMVDTHISSQISALTNKS